MSEENARFEMRWPREQLVIESYGHQIMNYRYHWHEDFYELTVLLSGKLEYCRGSDTGFLEENDVVLTSPGRGHASFSLADMSRTIVIHFSPSVFKPYLKKGTSFQFPECWSDEKTRNTRKYRLLRFYAVQVYQAMSSDKPYAAQIAKAAMIMLASALVEYFNPVVVKGTPEEDDGQKEAVGALISYMEKHYAEKITLEDLAGISNYNRTYVSTLFKNTVNMNFHDFLTRIRFRNALSDLALSDAPLTEIAIRNGFADLKTFNAKFKEVLHRSPAEYRKQLDPDRIAPDEYTLFYVPPEDPLIQRKITEYTSIFPLE